MSIMDKETIIALTKGEGDKLKLICDYCSEMGKEDMDISKFIMALMMSPSHLEWCFHYALDYYQRKFNICILYSKEGRIINVY